MRWPLKDQARAMTAGDTRHHTIIHARTTFGLLCGACNHGWEVQGGNQSIITCPSCGASLPAWALPQ